MRPLLSALVLLLLALGAPASPAVAQQPEDRPDFAIEPLAIHTVDGERHAFTVEIADTRAKRSFGLMFVRELAPDRGMLFDFKRSRRVSMWMKNTYIPLDMLFIEADGTVESIIERTTPHSLKPRGSKGRVQAVLELAGGTVDRLGLAPGDRIDHPIFQ